MTKYVINGGKTLNGEVTISGAKNAAVAIVPAALLADGPVRIENVPKIIDVTLQMEIMRELGAQIRLINSTTVETQNPSLKPHELERKLRASYYLLGVLLGKYGFAEVAMPGGCNFGGVRPIDQHIKGFEALGAKVTLPKGGYIRVEAPEDGLHGAHIYFDVVTVGATMNIMLAAVLAKGQTIMENCAKEPHIVDLANFLNALGAENKPKKSRGFFGFGRRKPEPKEREPKIEQSEFKFMEMSEQRGFFEDTPVNIRKGEDLDVPTFMRRNIKINL